MALACRGSLSGPAPAWPAPALWRTCNSLLGRRGVVRPRPVAGSSSSRRAALLAGSSLLHSGHLKAVAHAATAVYHEVTIRLDEGDEDGEQGGEHDAPEEPALDPPTYVTATGRIIASEWIIANKAGLYRLPRVSPAVACVLLLLPSLTLPRHPLIAVGDLHGDMAKTIKSLTIARVAEERDGDIVWTGGDTVVVQLGDVLDRGDTEIGAHLVEAQGAVSFATASQAP